MIGFAFDFHHFYKEADHMKHTLARRLLALFGICLLLGTSLRATTSYASGTDFGVYILRFFEIGPAKFNANQLPALMFGVKDDGKTFLAILRKLPEAYSNYIEDADLVWHQEGTLTTAELNRVKLAQTGLIGVPDQYWPGNDYAIDRVAQATGPKDARLLLNNQLKRANASDSAAVQNAVQIILQIRKRFEPMVVFNWSGGFGRRSSQLTIQSECQVTYPDALLGTTVTDNMTPRDI